MKKELKDAYYEAWTADGLTDYHADAEAAKIWLLDKDIYTEDDERTIGRMSDEEITELAEALADMAKEELENN